MLLIAALAGLGGGYAFYRSSSSRPPSGLPAVAPDRPDLLEPEVADLVHRQIAQVNANPGDAEAHGTLGMIYSANGLVHEARRSFEQAARLAPRNRNWPFQAAIARKGGGDFEGALREFRRLADLYPNFAALQHRLGDALLETGVLEEADAAFQKAAALSPGRPEPYVGLAEVKLRRREFAVASNLLEKARDLDPSYRLVHFLLGQAYRGVGRREEAARELALGVEAEKRYLPDEASGRTANLVTGFAARFSRASQFLEGRRFDEAARLFADLLVDQPDNTDVMNNLSIAYLKLRRFEDALAVLRRAERRDPTAFATYINLVECLLAMNRAAEAVPYGEKAAELAPRVGQAQFARARALIAVQRYDEAREALLATLRLDARNPEAYMMLGDVCARLGRLEEAKEALATAAKRMPKSPAVHVRLSLICLRLKQYEEASAALETARQLAPDDPTIQSLSDRIAAARP